MFDRLWRLSNGDLVFLAAGFGMNIGPAFRQEGDDPTVWVKLVTNLRRLDRAELEREYRAVLTKGPTGH